MTAARRAAHCRKPLLVHPRPTPLHYRPMAQVIPWDDDDYIEDHIECVVPTTADYEAMTRRTCDRALWQPDTVARMWMRDVIVYRCNYRAIVEAEYPRLVPHLDYAERHDIDDKRIKPTITNGSNSALTAEQREAITGTWDKEGGWIVTGVLTPRGKRPSLLASAANRIAGRDNLERVAAIEAVGLRVLEECARKWNPSRGKLWTFAKQRVEGAMKDYLRDCKPGKFYGYDEEHHHHSEGADGDWNGSAARARADWHMDGMLGAPNDKKAPHGRAAIGGKLPEQSYIQREAQHAADTQPQETAGKLDKALAKLKPEERDAFRNRYMTPESKKLSRSQMARRWSVSPQYIGRLERNAKRKLQKDTRMQF
jgi:RNA polymerase sigma factor (sigma-70 family)